MCSFRSSSSTACRARLFYETNACLKLDSLRPPFWKSEKNGLGEEGRRRGEGRGREREVIIIKVFSPLPPPPF